MKSMKNTEKYARLILLPLVAFMLILSMVLPSVVLAADASIITVYPGTITQDDINTKSSTIKFTLSSNHSWGKGINTADLIAGMITSSETDEWNAYKSKIGMAITNQTLTLTLPKAVYDIKADQTIAMELPTAQVKDGAEIVTYVPVSFIITHTKTSTLTITPTSVTEADIQTGKAVITLTLTDNEWSIDSDTKRQDLINALVPKDQKEQWDKVKNMLSISDTTGDTLVITLPKVSDYKLGTNQTVTLNVPQQLLKNNTRINEAEFTINAAPKVLITGTATPKVTQTDIINGGKTIVVTVVNGVWANDIASNSASGQKLLKGFMFDPAYKDAINAGANVVRTNDEVVTIILPPLAEYKVGADTLIKFDASAITATGSSNTGILDAFTITPITNQSAIVSGSIVGSNEFDIAKGGKEMIVTLKNDSWTTDLMKLEKFQPKFVDVEDKPVTLPIKKVERTSDTVLTITLEKDSGFMLTDDISVKLTIPADILATSGSPITPSAFKITAVQAELPSGKDIVLDQVDIQKGGKIISITLKNAAFKEKLEIDKDLVESIFTVSNSITTALEDNLSNITITKNRISIRLPAVSDYNSLEADTFGMKIPKELIDHDTAKDLDVIGEITTGAVATVELDPQTATFTDEKIKAGTAKINLTLTGTEWDPTLPTNISKKAALLKGFTVTDQTKEWAILSREISTNGKIELSADQKTLTITVPKVTGYSIIRDQVVNIKIPKTVLVNYKEDLPVAEQLTITVPTFDGGTSLDKLTEKEFEDAIIKNKRLNVPSKKVEKIIVNTVDTGKETPSITTIEVTAAAGVKNVQVIVEEGEKKTVMHVGDTQSTSTFVYVGLEKNSELEIQVFGDGTEPLQSPIYKKIGKGNKVYTEIPKKDLAGAYLLYDILTQKALLKDILKYYSIDELKVN